MNNYEINIDTLAILPYEEGKSKVIESKREIIVNCLPIDIIDNSCKFFGSTYDGRFNGVTGAIMQSDENKNKVLKRAKENIYWLTSREDALEEALEYYNLTESDFTDIDYNYLIQWAQGIRN